MFPTTHFDLLHLTLTYFIIVITIPFIYLIHLTISCEDYLIILIKLHFPESFSLILIFVNHVAFLAHDYILFIAIAEQQHSLIHFKLFLAHLINSVFIYRPPRIIHDSVLRTNYGDC